jgi:TrkA domain protein
VVSVEIEESPLPGIGLRHDFATAGGRRVGVISHRTGRRDLVTYSQDDPDACSETIALTGEESDALAELLGAPRIVARLDALHQQVEGLVSKRIGVAPGSPYDGRTLGETEARSRTGASIVAVVRFGEVFTSPTPEFTFADGDAVVVVGSEEGTEAVRAILDEG